MPLPSFIAKYFANSQYNTIIKRNDLLTRQVRSLVSEIQGAVDITTNTDSTAVRHYLGTPSRYNSYSKQVTQLGKLYDNTADWGCMIAKNVIDMRTAFSVGKGVRVVKHKDFKGDATKELAWCKEFMRFNNLDEEMPQEYAKEAEIEGKILLRFLVDETAKNVRVIHVPWRKFNYTIYTPDWDFFNYNKAEYIGSGEPGIKFDLTREFFVYKRFGGGASKINETPPKTAFIIREMEDLDRAIVDWRKINKLFSAPTPTITCPDMQTAKDVQDKLDGSNWRIGKLLVIGGIDIKFDLVGWKGDGYTTLKEETQTLAKTISGTTGIPVHFLGYPELLSNRDCYSEDTETLTENGWKNYWEIVEGERIACFDPTNENMTFEVPTGLHVYQYQGEMLHFENAQIDTLVTPDHKMWANFSQGYGNGDPGQSPRSWSKIEAKNLASHFWIRFRSCCGWEGAQPEGDVQIPEHVSKLMKRDKQPTRFTSSDFMEFLGYYLSEGGTGVYKLKANNTEHAIIHIAQAPGDVADKIQECLTRMRLKFNRTLYDGCYRWHIHHYGLHCLLKANFGEGHLSKRIPGSIRNFPVGLLSILFDALMCGDGSWDKRENKTSGYYSTTSKELADNFQEIALKLGYNASVASNHGRTKGKRVPLYRVSICVKKTNRMKGSQVKRVDYDGVIYCFSTLTGLFITRRNGKVAIQGNTAENLIELIVLSTNKERNTWMGAYEELFQKAMIIYNTVYGTTLNPMAVDSTIDKPELTTIGGAANAPVSQSSSNTSSQSDTA